MRNTQGFPPDPLCGRARYVVSHVSQNGVKLRHYLHRFSRFEETVTKRPVIYTVFRARLMLST